MGGAYNFRCSSQPEVPLQFAPDVFAPHGFISLECSHFDTCSGLIREVMAMQRKGKEGRANGDSVHEEKASELTEKRSECINLWLLMAGRVGKKCLSMLCPTTPLSDR